MRFSISILVSVTLLAFAPGSPSQEPSPPATPQQPEQLQPAAPEQPPTAPRPAPLSPIAIVPLDLAHPDRGPRISGTVQVSNGKAIVTSSADVTSGPETTQVELPRRGVLRVCASTTVHLSSDSSVPAGETPGLMMAIDHGAVEADFATGRNADIVLTPDFRILIGGGQGAVDVKVRIGDHGDTCIDNPGADAPYVLVSSVFDGGAYRVQPGQRVLFEHGSLNEVNDNEKEPCGCPPPTPEPGQANAFPLAQSQGLAPLAPPAPSPPAPTSQPPATVPPLVHNAPRPDASPAPQTQLTSAPAAAVASPAPPRKKPGFFRRLGGFFRRIFGAE